MRVEPFNLKNFDAGTVAIPAGGKTFLPGGRRRGEGPPLPPPTYNQEQLKAAEAESRQKGFLEGIEEGKKIQDSEQAATDRKLAGVLETLARFTAPLFADYRAAVTAMQQEMPKVALAIARKVAGPALKENAAAVAEETAMKCLGVMMGEPKITITVHSSLTEALKKKIEAMKASQPAMGDITVAGDESLPAEDCRVEWKHGAFQRTTEKLWQDLAATVENLAATAKHEAEAHMEKINPASRDPSAETLAKAEAAAQDLSKSST